MVYFKKRFRRSNRMCMFTPDRAFSINFLRLKFTHPKHVGRISFLHLPRVTIPCLDYHSSRCVFSIAAPIPPLDTLCFRIGGVLHGDTATASLLYITICMSMNICPFGTFERVGGIEPLRQ